MRNGSCNSRRGAPTTAGNPFRQRTLLVYGGCILAQMALCGVVAWIGDVVVLISMLGLMAIGHTVARSSL